MYLIFDTETTGLPKNYNAPISDLDNWPRIVQLAWQIHDKEGNLIDNKDYIIYPDGFDIPFNVTKVHGISTELAKKEGRDLNEVLNEFNEDLKKSQVIIGHNVDFDINITGSEFYRQNIETPLTKIKKLDTQHIGTPVCKLPGGKGGKFKYPKLSELYTFLFDKTFDEAHNATADVNATARCFFELLRLNHVSAKEALITEEEKQNFIENFTNGIPVFDVVVRDQVNAFNQQNSDNFNLKTKKNVDLKTKNFFHFHNHTIFSILQSTTKIPNLVDFAYQNNLPAIGICDYGNLMGAFTFINEVKKINAKIKSENEELEENGNVDDLKKEIIPVIGCEIFISEQYEKNKFTKDNPDKRYTQVLLAKNLNGFKNLSKISTTGFTKGLYMDFPRVGKEIVEQYKTDLIATTGNIDSEIPDLILNKGISYAEEMFVWWKDTFKDDFYVQLQNHNIPEEQHVNEILIGFAKKYDVKIIAQNCTFYVDKSEYETHDIALCIKSNAQKNTPVGKGFKNRLGMPTKEFYLKEVDEFASYFSAIPESLSNYDEFLNKFSFYDLAHDVLLPKFAIPEEFQNELDNEDGGKRGENAYLKHLTFDGAKKRYEEITPEIEQRLNFELETIEKTGYPGYFLIVQDFTSQARKMGVSVGPGRGSAAGSAVAYCIGITNVDPVKYDLLFERFLNPDRVSLPDIDIDFDDRGRDKIIDWVVKKYGQNQVAQIITYGKLAGRSALRDTSRVLELPLNEAGKLAKGLPPSLSLNKIKNKSKDELEKEVRPEEIQGVQILKNALDEQNLVGQVVSEAVKLEGCIRNTGVHACGVIITPEDITNLIPVTVAKDAELLVSQFDNSVVESAGLLKMDFLGLKNLTIIQDACEIIEQRHGVKINPDEIPLDDEKTLELFQRGETVGIFQFESLGMQKHLKALKPDKFDDLIAMNALYRPGPIKYIPNFINRKHGIEEIAYDLPEMEEYLNNTYGITVYQEQVMLLSQKLANFTKGEADVLRKAMGKKQRAVLDKMKGKFIENGIKNNHPEKVLDKIWTDWEAFAAYAFNKSHSTCYSFVAFQTAYLKANYPSEYMAALLSNNLNNITTTSFFMEETKRMGINVLGPNINESFYRFTADKDGNIRFGLGAVKGIGEGAIEAIISERKENGKFVNLFDFLERVSSVAINKKVLESLVLAGALDELDSYHRSQYFAEDNLGTTVEKLIKYSTNYKESQNSSQISLFDNTDEGFDVMKPTIPDCDEWNKFQKLSKEKETIGIYISSHPMDEYKYELEFLKPKNLIDLENNKEEFLNKEIYVAGMVVKADEWKSGDGRKISGTLFLEDITGTQSFRLFDDEYLKNQHLFTENLFVGLKIVYKKSKYNDSIYPNVLSVFQLKEVFEKKVKQLTIDLDIVKFNEEKRKEITDLIEKYKGENSLKINLIDNQEKTSISLNASKGKINICKELLEELTTAKFNSYLN
ncbi:MAG: DNA polymerase III subunit alpha [Flavobacteriales bacterium]|nr:DNA polymerase III subunit alpha [Flavobacteriales bacterium]